MSINYKNTCKDDVFCKSNTEEQSKRFSENTERFLSFSACTRSVMVKPLGCGIVVSDFELQLRFHFQTNNVGQGMNPFILPAMD